MPWQPLYAFDDRSVPKLHNLNRAARAGLRVPPTVWARADAGPQPRPDGTAFALPCIVRSGSPTEDTRQTSNAGQFVTVVVRPGDSFDAAVAEVIAALPMEAGRRLGVVFVQPFVESARAGVTFFDGYYYEEASADGGNEAITSGRERGEVTRGQVERGNARDEWLARVHKIFGGVLDIEWAEPAEGGRVLLQVRPALFPLRRCQTLSLANHKEILGDPPSPWMVGLLAEAGRPVMRFFERVDPAVAAWEETYAVELAGRAWMNFSAFFRLMDHWGLPRSTVTEGVGGANAGPLDARHLPVRLVRSLPVFPRLLLACVGTVLRSGRDLLALDDELAKAETLSDLQRLNVRALELSITTNFAVMSLLSGVSKIRKRLGLGQAGRVVTRDMMDEYAALAARPDLTARLAGLDSWLARYGHRGPLESDPMRPRFSELRDALNADLARGPAPKPPEHPRPSWLIATLARPFFLLDEVRESFRDRSMRWWQKLRLRVLDQAGADVRDGRLKQADDVFFLRADDLAAGPNTWRDRVAKNRASHESASRLTLPMTAPRDTIEAAVADGPGGGTAPESAREFRGIGLSRSSRIVTGTAVRVASLTDLLQRSQWPDEPVLVVDTLEPSWAVAFSRFSAVVAELGGELSHASILLREAGIPAVVNAQGAYRAIADGETVRVDPASGSVRVGPRGD